MKTSSDDLFRLVKSLNKSEKGFFKKFAAKNEAGSKQNYILLFNALDAMDEYDEDALRKKFKNQPFIKQLAVYKVYLFNLILKSLNQYGAYDNSVTKIKELIENSKTLSAKGLHKDSLKLLKKAKELATKYKSQSHLLEILVAERNILVVLPDKNVYENRKKIYEELKEFGAHVLKYAEYSWLSDQLVIFIEQTGDYTKENRENDIKKILTHPYITDEKNTEEDYLYKTYFYHAHLLYSISKNNIPEVHRILKSELELLEKHRHMIDDNPKNYIQTLINFLLASNLLKKKDDIREGIVKLNALRKRIKNKVSLSLEIHTLFHGANTEILIYRNNGDLKRGRAAARKIEEWFVKYSNEIPSQLKVTLLSNTAAFYVIDEKYEEALRLTAVMLKESSLKFRSDINFFARIFQLLLHYELRNYDLLEYLINSSYKFLKENNALRKAENALFDFFKQAVKTSEEEHPALFDELHFRLAKLQNDNYAISLMTTFDFISWAESRSKGEKLIETINRKNK